jgi:tripartite-type tricarboxylate transporter receptor subunit TctC
MILRRIFPRRASKVRPSVSLVIVVPLLLWLVSLASAQTPDDFYRNKILTIVVGNPPAGVFDVQARLLARHMARHLAGHPTIVVQNLPGAGGLKAANYLYRVAPHDGTFFGIFADGLILQQLLDPQGIQFDARRFQWIGGFTQETSIVYAWHLSSFENLGDVTKREMRVAGSGAGANSVVYPRVLNRILGTKFKVVSGYPGAADTMLAVERGEVDGQVGGTWANLMSIKPDWLSSGKIRILAQLGQKKLFQLPNVPLVIDMVHNATDRSALALLLSKQAIGYPFVAPPGIPEDRLAALRDAFEKTVRDPEFEHDPASQQLDVNLVTGGEIEKLVEGLFASPPGIVVRAKALVANTE